LIPSSIKPSEVTPMNFPALGDHLPSAHRRKRE
jgi:hypothetical protein